MEVGCDGDSSQESSNSPRGGTETTRTALPQNRFRIRQTSPIATPYHCVCSGPLGDKDEAAGTSACPLHQRSTRPPEIPGMTAPHQIPASRMDTRSRDNCSALCSGPKIDREGLHRPRIRFQDFSPAGTGFSPLGLPQGSGSLSRRDLGRESPALPAGHPTGEPSLPTGVLPTGRASLPAGGPRGEASPEGRESVLQRTPPLEKVCPPAKPM